MPRGEVELRCTCSHHTLLGVGYRDPRTGEPRLHIKVFKQGRVFGEIVATSGTVHVRCRDCSRWSQVTIRRVPSMTLSPSDESILAGLAT